MKTITKEQVKEITAFRKRRERLGLKLREVEDDTGISNAYISMLESDKMKNPSFYTVVKLHNYYRKMEVEARKSKPRKTRK